MKIFKLNKKSNNYLKIYLTVDLKKLNSLFISSTYDVDF